MHLRSNIYRMVEPGHSTDSLSTTYDAAIVFLILLSFLPLTTQHEYTFFVAADCITFLFFLIDYVLRLLTADFRAPDRKHPFLTYPLTFPALCDILSLLSCLDLINPAFRLLRTVRILMTLQVFRSMRRSHTFNLMSRVIRQQKEALNAFACLAVLYVMVVALIMLNVEPQTFTSYLDAVYWTTTTLTTIGFGDLTASSSAGKIIAILSAPLGIALVAFPTGIITAGYMNELQADAEREDDSDA